MNSSLWISVHFQLELIYFENIWIDHDSQYRWLQVGTNGFFSKEIWFIMFSFYNRLIIKLAFSSHGHQSLCLPSIKSGC